MAEQEQVKLVKLRYNGQRQDQFGGRLEGPDGKPFVWVVTPSESREIEVPEFAAYAIVSDPAGTWERTDDRARTVSQERAEGEIAAQFGEQPLPPTTVTEGQVTPVLEEKRKR